MATMAASFIVVALIKCFGASLWVRSLALASCLALMMASGSVHPPAAGAVMAVIDSAKLQSLGFAFVLYPTLVGKDCGGGVRREGERGEDTEPDLEPVPEPGEGRLG